MEHETVRSTSSNTSPSMFIHSGPSMNITLNLRAVCRWTTFAGNVTAVANRILSTNVSLQGAAFSGSSHSNTTGFSPQAIFENGILSSPAGSQIKLCVITLSQLEANRSTLAVFCTDTSFLVGSRSTTTVARFAAAATASYKISCQKLASGAISQNSPLISPQ
jgi:hypothetical protein